MINWILVSTIPFAVIMGMAFGRRKQTAAGEIYCFQPFWIFQALSLIIAAGLALFIESARVSLSNPSPFHLWLLILSAATTMVMQVILSSIELRYAKKHIP